MVVAPTRVSVLTAPLSAPMVAAMAATTVAGAASAGVTVLTGHAPTGILSTLIQALTLAASVLVQTRAVWRVRDEPTWRYLGLTTMSASTVILLTSTTLFIGATATWIIWATCIDSHVQDAMSGCAAAATCAGSLFAWLSRQTAPDQPLATGNK